MTMGRVDRPALGMGLMIATTLVFSIQDGISRHLAATYPTVMVVMIRYWFFALVVLVWAARQRGGLRRVAQTPRPGLQITRGLLLAAEIVVTVYGFVLIGLAATHAIFACYPLLVAALSAPLLREPLGWRRWTAIGLGFLGILIIVRPGFAVFSPAALIPFASAALFALYQVLTRKVSAHDSAATSFFYTGMAGAVALTIVGLPSLQPMATDDMVWMAALCVSGVIGHFLLITALGVTRAANVQPLTYLHLVFASAVGVMFFDEMIDHWTVIGATVIIATGLFTLRRGWRHHDHTA